VWPETDVYVTLNSRLRASLSSSRSKDGESASSIDIGPNLDVMLLSFRGRKTAGPDASKRKFLTFRAGYHYLFSFGGDQETEQRGILELTPHFYLPKDLLLTDRSRADLRVISGDFSWRYRNRVSLERTFKVKSKTMTPYLRGEVYYDSHYGAWIKNTFSAGVVFPVGKRIELEPYIARDNDSRSSNPHVTALGFTFSLYLDPFHRKP
jgi:hypothetical protein